MSKSERFPDPQGPEMLCTPLDLPVPKSGPFPLSTLGRMENERVAASLVRVCVDEGGWVGVLAEELERLYAEDFPPALDTPRCGVRGYVRGIEGLVAGGYIRLASYDESTGVFATTELEDYDENTVVFATTELVNRVVAHHEMMRKRTG